MIKDRNFFAQGCLVGICMLLLPIGALYCLAHWRSLRGPAWISVADLMPLAIAIAVFLADRKRRKTVAKQVEGEKDVHRWAPILIGLLLLPAIVPAICYAAILYFTFGSRKSMGWREWFKSTNRSAVALTIIAPQLILAYYLVASGSIYSGIYLSACGAYSSFVGATTGLAMKKGVLNIFTTEDQDTSPGYILACAIAFAISFGSLHFGIWSLNHTSYANVHHWDDALYFSVITMATVGYGDISPTARIAKWAVMLEIVCGFVLLVLALNATLTVWIQKHQPQGDDVKSGDVAKPEA